MKKNKLEAFLLNIISRLKPSPEDYCSLETVEGDSNIVAIDGSLLSVIEFHGTKSILGAGQFEELVQNFTESLQPFLTTRGHQLQVVFSRDTNNRGAGFLNDNAVRQKKTAHAIGLQLDDLIDENVCIYNDYVYDERCFFGLWSRPALLDPAETSIDARDKNKLRADTNFPAIENAQNILRPIPFLIDRHASYVYKILGDLRSSSFGCSLDLLDLDDAIREIRSSVLKNCTNSTWKASYPRLEKNGNSRTIGFRWKENSDFEDASELMYPTLSSQIMTTSAEIASKKEHRPLDSTMVFFGGRVYAPMIFDVPPRDPKRFNILFDTLNNAATKENGMNRAMPYCVSYMLEGDGMTGHTFKRALSSVLFFASSTNRSINAAFRALSDYKEDSPSIIKLRIAAMTWAEMTDEGLREIILRKNKLVRILQGWGNPIISDRIGDPMEGLQTCALGLSPNHIAPACPAPLYDASFLLPLTRPTSPFHMGSITFRSLDGKILLYQRFSSLQTNWITLIVGKPGSGKSVLANNINVEACLLPDMRVLPYIAVIDVGISSSGFVSLIKDSLPEDKKHLAIYERLENTARKSVNPLDTPLGLRKPLSKDMAFIRNFVTMLVTPAEADKPMERMSAFVGRVLEMAYRRKSDISDERTPDIYRAGHNNTIDEGIKRLGNIRITQHTKYWDLVDAFFDAEMYYEAEVAQRYAVPTLNDLTQFAKSEAIYSEYGNTEHGRNLIETFCIGINEAVNDYPVFAQPTAFDVGSARIISLDLQDVVLSGTSPSNYKQTALMYMIARQLFMKKIAFSKEDLPEIQEKYKDYYSRMISDLIDVYKCLFMDEYHRTGQHAMLQQQIDADGREGRKWLLEIILASQRLEDLQALIDIASTYFILDSGTTATRKMLQEKVGITPEQEAALKKFVHGPTSYGATFLAIFKTINATYTQLFTLTPGAMRLWALSTTAEDRKLRDIIYSKMPHDEARRLLAARFPSGSCKRMVEQLKSSMETDDSFLSEQQYNSIVEKIANEMLTEYFSGRINLKEA